MSGPPDKKVSTLLPANLGSSLPHPALDTKEMPSDNHRPASKLYEWLIEQSLTTVHPKRKADVCAAPETAKRWWQRNLGTATVKPSRLKLSTLDQILRFLQDERPGQRSEWGPLVKDWVDDHPNSEAGIATNTFATVLATIVAESADRPPAADKPIDWTTLPEKFIWSRPLVESMINEIRQRAEKFFTTDPDEFELPRPLVLVVTGPPGCGKTYFLARLRYALMNAQRDYHVRFVSVRGTVTHSDGERAGDDHSRLLFVVDGFRPNGSSPGDRTLSEELVNRRNGDSLRTVVVTTRDTGGERLEPDWYDESRIALPELKREEQIGYAEWRQAFPALRIQPPPCDESLTPCANFLLMAWRLDRRLESGGSLERFAHRLKPLVNEQSRWMIMARALQLHFSFELMEREVVCACFDMVLGPSVRSDPRPLHFLIARELYQRLDPPETEELFAKDVSSMVCYLSAEDNWGKAQTTAVMRKVCRESVWRPIGYGGGDESFKFSAEILRHLIHDARHNHPLRMAGLRLARLIAALGPEPHPAKEAALDCLRGQDYQTLYEESKGTSDEGFALMLSITYREDNFFLYSAVAGFKYGSLRSDNWAAPLMREVLRRRTTITGLEDELFEITVRHRWYRDDTDPLNRKQPQRALEHIMKLFPDEINSKGPLKRAFQNAFEDQLVKSDNWTKMGWALECFLKSMPDAEVVGRMVDEHLYHDTATAPKTRWFYVRQKLGQFPSVFDHYVERADFMLADPLFPVRFKDLLELAWARAERVAEERGVSRQQAFGQILGYEDERAGLAWRNSWVSRMANAWGVRMTDGKENWRTPWAGLVHFVLAKTNHRLRNKGEQRVRRRELAQWWREATPVRNPAVVGISAWIMAWSTEGSSDFREYPVQEFRKWVSFEAHPSASVCLREAIDELRGGPARHHSTSRALLKCWDRKMLGSKSARSPFRTN